MSVVNIKDLVNKRVTKSVKFMGVPVNISKLSVNEVIRIQELAEATKDSVEGTMELLRYVISTSATGFEEVTDDEFLQFPMEELQQLSEAIIAYSGMGKKA